MLGVQPRIPSDGERRRLPRVVPVSEGDAEVANRILCALAQSGHAAKVVLTRAPEALLFRTRGEIQELGGKRITK